MVVCFVTIVEATDATKPTNRGSEHDNYHVIVVTECSQHPIFRIEYQSTLCHETYPMMLCKITWQLPCDTT